MRRLLFFFAGNVWLSCTPADSSKLAQQCSQSAPVSSSLKLDGGIAAPLDGGAVSLPSYLLEVSVENDSPPPRFCTGTAVSSSTIVTAAHCVFGLTNDVDIDMDNGSAMISNVKVCASRENPELKEFCSNAIFYERSFASDQISDHDLAWVGFPVGTFTDYYALDDRDPRADGKFLAVGFGPDQSTQRPNLKYGLNTFQSSVGGALFTSSQQDFDNTTLVPGDSGGPILVDCKILGIASQITAAQQNKYSNLLKKHQLLRQVSGPLLGARPVHFCGVSTVADSKASQQLCPTNGLHQSILSIEKARDHFPCGKVTPTPDQPASHYDSPTDPPTDPSDEASQEATCPNQDKKGA